jgi:hypothetical protein
LRAVSHLLWTFFASASALASSRSATSKSN